MYEEGKGRGVSTSLLRKNIAVPITKIIITYYVYLLSLLVDVNELKRLNLKCEYNELHINAYSVICAS